MDAVCRQYHNRFDWNIQKQSAITNEYSMALREVCNSIELAQGEPDDALHWSTNTVNVNTMNSAKC